MRSKGNADKDRPGFGPMGGGMNGPHIGMMEKDLGLSTEQVDKIYKVHRNYMDRFYQSRNDADKVRELRAKQDKEIESILTPEQKKKLDELKTKHPMNGKKPGDGKGRHRMMDNNK